MSVQYGGHLPLNVTRCNGFQLCESCKVKTAKYRVELPVGPGVEHFLCKNCKP